LFVLCGFGYAASCISPQRDKEGPFCYSRAIPILNPPSFRSTGQGQDFIILIKVPGDERNWSAVVHVPPVLSSTNVPVLLAFHGYRQNGLFMECYTGLNRWVDTHQMLVIYPNANPAYPLSNGTWPIYYDRDHATSYLAYFDALRNMISDKLSPRHDLYLTGVSNGGNMVSLLSRMRSDVLRGISMVAGSYFVTSNITTTPKPLSVLSVHGTKDPVVPYSTVPPWLKQWSEWNGFHGKIIEKPYAEDATLFTWTELSGSNQMAAIRVDGGKHAWPCSDIAYGGPPQTFFASEAVVEFFSNLSQYYK